MRGLCLVAASGGHSSSRCAGLSLSRPLPLRGTGSRRAGSAIVAQGLSCSAACGIFPDQGSNSCPLHWQADSQPLRHQGSPGCSILNYHQQCTRVPNFSTSSPTLVIFCVFDNSHSNGCEVVSHPGFDLLSLEVSDFSLKVIFELPTSSAGWCPSNR